MYFLTLLMLLTFACIMANQCCIVYIGACLVSVTFVVYQLGMLGQIRMNVKQPASRKHREREKDRNKCGYAQLFGALGNKLIQVAKLGMFVSWLHKNKSKLATCHHSGFNMYQLQPLTPTQQNPLKQSNTSCSTSTNTNTSINANTNSNANTNMDGQQTTTMFSQTDEQVYEARIQYINILMFKHLRQFMVSALYGGCVGFVMGWGVAGWEGFVHRFTLQSVIYLVPLIVNSLWKLQRIYTYIIYQRNPPASANPTPTNTNTTPLLILADCSQPYSAEEQDVEFIVQLIHLQAVAEILVILYLILHSTINIGYSLMQIGSHFLKPIYYYTPAYLSVGGQLAVGDVWGWMRYGVNRLVVMALGVMYLLIRDWYSVGKQYGMRQALWQTHCTVDKYARLVSPDLRKMYHRQVHKAIKKLLKYKLIQPTLKKPQINYSDPYTFIDCECI